MISFKNITHTNDFPLNGYPASSCNFRCIRVDIDVICLSVFTMSLARIKGIS